MAPEVVEFFERKKNGGIEFTAVNGRILGVSIRTNRRVGENRATAVK